MTDAPQNSAADSATPTSSAPASGAADGMALPVAHTFAQLLQVLEDGQLHADISDGLREIAAGLTQYVIENGGRPKGKLTINLDFTLDEGVIDVRGAFTVKTPKPPRGKTILWLTPENRFTPQNPKQMQMFGVRDVTPHHPTRNL